MDATSVTTDQSTVVPPKVLSETIADYAIKHYFGKADVGRSHVVTNPASGRKMKVFINSELVLSIHYYFDSDANTPFVGHVTLRNFISVTAPGLPKFKGKYSEASGRMVLHVAGLGELYGGLSEADVARIWAWYDTDPNNTQMSLK
jgi:hypothetical protein